MPPDRAAWLEKHGTTPKPIKASAVFVKRAEAIVEQESAAQDPCEVQRLAADMEHLCGSVRYAYQLDTINTIVYYDPSEKTFYAYSRT